MQARIAAGLRTGEAFRPSSAIASPGQLATDAKLRENALSEIKRVVRKASQTGDPEMKKRLLMVAASAAQRYEQMGIDIEGAGKRIAMQAVRSHLTGSRRDYDEIKSIGEAFGLSKMEMAEAAGDAASDLFGERRPMDAIDIVRTSASWAKA